ncbi:MAG TPA: sigma-70 family RNA polymerase sigma factor [Candidatus Desulfofervidus auxilii]|uniref:Sigma-70 family RNA polymerase sigma factor n=1 Tax=Desulfofervidus auxilii TaxID=1621989 RepID=A0A7V0NF22_DESA2|nr:sigma-70 family RNA polymerase sigma factor [Candidatus Desulfofervidus auxilii]
MLKRRSKDKDEDVKLVERAKANDKKAFDQLVIKYRERVVGLCYSMLLDEFKAEDAAQETFTRTWQAIKKLDTPSAFYTYLYRIAVRVCLGIIGKEKRSREKLFSEIEKERR